MSSKEYEEIKKDLTVVMLSKNQADLYGQMIPKEAMGDMTMAYQIEHDDRKSLVTLADLSRYQVTATELHDDALNNATQKHMAMVQTLEGALGLPPVRPRGVPTMYVVSNMQGEEGAAAICYPGMMERLTELVGGDFAILPSSIHEMLVVQTEGADLGKLEAMLNRVNREEVAPEDLLSNTLYCYDAKSRMVMRASVYEQLKARDAVLCEKSPAFEADKTSVLKDLQNKDLHISDTPQPAKSRTGKELSL